LNYRNHAKEIKEQKEGIQRVFVGAEKGITLSWSLVEEDKRIARCSR
jgi:hypothetical protein